MTLSDKNDYERILDSYGDIVFSIAMTHLIDRSVAEDVSQDVLLKLVSHIFSIRDEEHLKYWLIRTSINKCISINRKTIRQINITAEETYTQDDTISSDMRMIKESLPAVYREAAMLCICDGLSAEEAAKILRRNSNTIRSQVQRARKMLQKELEGTI